MSGTDSATLHDVWRAGVKRLEAAGVEEAGPDAELLLMHVLRKSKTELLRDWREPWPQDPGLQSAWEGYLSRRSSGEPVQYVIGEQYFYGRRFEVNRGVLIPRPETELLVEAILAAADRIWPVGDGAIDGSSAAMSRARMGTVPHVLDVGTGSGAIAVTLAVERPGWRVTASDLSPAALDVARQNAEKLGASDRLRFMQGNLLEPFVKDGGDSGHAGFTSQATAQVVVSKQDIPETASADAPSEVSETTDIPAAKLPVDILVSNPPYIPSGDLPGLQREVRDYEPHLALDGGDDGLTPYRLMAEQLQSLPVPPRIVGWEVGAGQAEDVADLLRKATDWKEIRYITDYAGIRRHVLAVR